MARKEGDTVSGRWIEKGERWIRGRYSKREVDREG